MSRKFARIQVKAHVKDDAVAELELVGRVARMRCCSEVVVKKVKSVYLKKSKKSVLTLTRKVPGLSTRDASPIHASLIHQQYDEHPS